MHPWLAKSVKKETDDMSAVFHAKLARVGRLSRGKRPFGDNLQKLA